MVINKFLNLLQKKITELQSSEIWKRKPYKRRDLEDLATIKTNMSEQEIKNRIKATYYPGKPAPFIKIYGHKFEFNPKR